MIKKITILCAILTLNSFASNSRYCDWCKSKNIEINIINNSQNDLLLDNYIFFQAKVDQDYTNSIIKKNSSKKIKLTTTIKSNYKILTDGFILLIKLDDNGLTLLNNSLEGITLGSIETFRYTPIRYTPNCEKSFQGVYIYIN